MFDQEQQVYRQFAALVLESLSNSFQFRRFDSENFENLLKNDNFRTDLHGKFSLKGVLKNWSWQGDFQVTTSTSVVKRISGAVSERIICFQSGTPSLEEAGNRIVLHIRDSIRLNSRIKVLVRTPDSDVLVILIGFFYQYLSYKNNCELTVEFGVSSNKQYINIKHYFKYLDVSNYLSFFPSFTGSDSTYYFFKKEQDTFL